MASPWPTSRNVTLSLSSLGSCRTTNQATIAVTAVPPSATLGGKPLRTLMAIVNDGDAVLIPDPFWVSYEACVHLAGGVPIRVPLRKEQGFHITSAALRARLTPRSKLLLLNSPNNPTCRVFRREELKTIAEVVLERDLWVLSDEIYEKINYDGHQHISIGSLPDMLERPIIVNGFSKSYAMTGWRLGYLAGREPLAEQILKVQQHSVSGEGHLRLSFATSTESIEQAIERTGAALQ